MEKRKIFIIGNGFDIAFKQPTRYVDLMDDIYNTVKNDEEISALDTYSDFALNVWSKDIVYGNLQSKFIKIDKRRQNRFIHALSSILFSELIKDHQSYGYWGNIEKKYYECLNNCKNNTQIRKLNDELDHLKELLIVYLNKIEKKIPQLNQLYRINNIQDIICNKDWTYDDFDYNHFFSSIYFVSFNYTSKILEQIVNLELPKTRNKEFYPEIIHIHGKLNDDNNPCVFGYGDDNSEVYRKIENKRDYDCLRQFKTKQYLKATQYHRLLAILEGYEIHIEIIGHSCEMCDKSLLRTIFTHPNVKKIKIDYHSNSDNYFKTVHNISKIIEDNIMLREKLEPINKCHIIK